MSNAMTHLRDGARQVRDLFSDLSTYSLVRPDWKTEVYAPRSLGDHNTKVELWYLAGHFLLAWHDWHTLRIRYRAFFGIEEHERSYRNSWARLDEHCSAFAVELLHSRDLDELLFDDWLMTGVIQTEDDATPSVREAVHIVIQNHRRWQLMRNSAAGSFRRLRESTAIQRQPEFGWLRCLRLVRRINDEAYSVCRRIDERVDGMLRQYLRRYGTANLLYSWLDHSNGAEGGQSGSHQGRGAQGSSQQPDEQVEIGESALIRLLSERLVTPSVEQYLAQLEDANTRGIVRHVLERVVNVIGEGSYDDFVDDVTSGEIGGGSNSLLGASEINLIPSRIPGACQAMLLAVSKGDRKAIGFTSIMREVRKHLIRCPQTNAVVVLCDFWTPGMLDEHLGDLRAHHGRGVRFLFLMAGLPRRTVSPVAVDLALTP